MYEENMAFEEDVNGAPLGMHTPWNVMTTLRPSANVLIPSVHWNAWNGRNALRAALARVLWHIDFPE